ncbi:MAG TPA: V-type ATP synthase subunit D [Thermoplasmata archaeon]|nr:V-type ATP synthase subunit D [Thermoplasmata archaeon]
MEKGDALNALGMLEYHVIPELKSTEAWIRQPLDEMERDNFMRLKHFKQVAEARAEAQVRFAVT